MSIKQQLSAYCEEVHIYLDLAYRHQMMCQPTASLSSCEAEYIGKAQATKEAVRLRRSLVELEAVDESSLSSPMNDIEDLKPPQLCFAGKEQELVVEKEEREALHEALTDVQTVIRRTRLIKPKAVTSLTNAEKAQYGAYMVQLAKWNSPLLHSASNKDATIGFILEIVCSQTPFDYFRACTKIGEHHRNNKMATCRDVGRFLEKLVAQEPDKQHLEVSAEVLKQRIGAE
ncbi:hypothetical protein K470DRAFT_269373 [Piedraia hortae CBS 480.64]|uniref:Uncharacterized protein n=1 Tax=Piedraia hortae CBS 480.64 TaxID=1314780 RepID=A0A6A7C4D1_9PEZI|nr:hypothetical protein K470DRAFT_269373 [Piedraia hortae CBS 480.64]